MRFAVLGPLQAWRDYAELDLGPPKRRSLLALLLLRAGHPIAVQEIVDALWGADPPTSAVNVVHRHVGALRRLFGDDPGAGPQLRRGSGGYRLDLPADALDLLRFREFRGAARRLADSGDPAGAAGLLVEALALWRGPAGTGLPPPVAGHPVFTAVNGVRLAAAKDAADLVLAAGGENLDAVLGTLGPLAADHPLNEDLQARLMLLLAAAGRQADALDVYETTRACLAGDLGLDPGAELRAAQQRVLRQAVPTGAAAADSPQPSVPTGAWTRPAQLPADLAVFSGRRDELATVNALIGGDSAPPPVMVISAIDGMAGVGKTTLAVHWAHGIVDRYPDGQLYVNLRGFHPTGAIMSAAEAVRSFLDALGVPARAIPAGLDAQAALYRSLLADRRVLVVLDNARDTEHVLPLLPGAAGCLVIVTSRAQLPGLVAGAGAHATTLGLLTGEDARELLARRLGEARLAREPGAVAEIIALCGHLPIALAVVSARAALNPGFSLDAIAGELRDGRGSLDAFTGEAPATDVRSVFSWSYRALTPPAARMFRLLALHPGPDAALPAAARLAGLPPSQARPLLAELARSHLISETAPGRYGFHELLRAYAGSLSGADPAGADGAADARGARPRLLDYYLHSAHAANLVMAPQREHLALAPPVAGADPERFGDERAAARWLDAERAAMLALIEQGATGEPAGGQVWQLAVTLERRLDREGRWQEQVVAQRAALASARALGDRAGQAYAHRALGFGYGRLDRWRDAEEHLLASLELFGATGDPAGQAMAHRYLAFLANGRGRHAEALDRYRLGLECYRAAGWLGGEASIHNEIGYTHLLLGEYDLALDRCRRSLALHQELGDDIGAAAAWDSVGSALHQLGRHDEALAAFAEAVARYERAQERYLLADTLVHVGDTHQARGASDLALTIWRRALGILDELGHPDAEPLRARLHGVGLRLVRPVPEPASGAG